MKPKTPRPPSISTERVKTRASGPTTAAVYTEADHAAIQAVAEGLANPEQQKRAIRWIVESAAGVQTLSYGTDPHATAFAEGKRFVGLQIYKLIRLRLDVTRRLSSKDNA